ncbi:MAG: AIM24 family protein [Nitrososphaerales archaeon]
MEVGASINQGGSAIATSFGSIKVITSGELVPVAEVSLAQGDSIFFEHHIFLWKDPTVTITAKAMKGVGKRMLAGLPVYVTEAHGPGRIAFSRDAPGQIIHLELKPGSAIHVREHQFLFSTSGVNYSYYRVKGLSSMLYGGTGLFVDTFEGSGILALHGYGNVFTKNLSSGEVLDVEPGGFLYKDAQVQISTNSMGLKSGLFGGFTFMMNRFTGPGRLVIQSMPFHMATGE